MFALSSQCLPTFRVKDYSPGNFGGKWKMQADLFLDWLALFVGLGAVAILL